MRIIQLFIFHVNKSKLWSNAGGINALADFKEGMWSVDLSYFYSASQAQKDFRMNVNQRAHLNILV